MSISPATLRTRPAGPRRARVRVILQDAPTECGAVCLAMVLTGHGRVVEPRELRDSMGIGRDGSTLADIAEAAEKHGLRTSAYRATPDALRDLPAPLIAHWGANHFVVVERVNERTATIVDPNSGRDHISRADFDASFNGVVLVLEPTADFQRQPRNTWEIPRFLSRFVPRSPGLITTVVTASVVFLTLGVVPAMVTRYLIDRVIPAGSLGLLSALGIGIALLVATQALLSFLRSDLLLRLRTLIDANLMTAFFGRLFRLPYSFFQLRTSGDILTRVSSGMMIREAISTHTLALFLDTTMALVYVSLLWWIAAPIGGVVLAAAVLQILIVAAFTRKVQEATRREIAAMTAAQTQLVESLSGIESLKASGGEGAIFERWKHLYRSQLTATFRKDTLGNRMELPLEAIRMGAPLVLLWTGAWLVMEGTMTLGTLVAANALAGMALAPITSLTRIYHSLQATGVHVRRLRDVFQEPEEISGDHAPAEVHGAVRLTNVSFGYQKGGTPAVSDVDLQIAPGSMVALVGRSGSGKSTLGKLLLGLHRPDSGTVHVDGEPLENWDVRALRGKCGVVVQDNTVFSGSILDNIRLHSPKASTEDVVRAAKLACLHEDIKRMPMGYLTPLGERGAGVSGGQRQRLGLARALVRRPRLLLLDEATSHLDAVTEAQIQDNIAGLECTRVVVAHRLSTVRQADLIVVLDNGRVVQTGTHDQLIDVPGPYLDLVSAGLAQAMSTTEGEQPGVSP